MSAAYDWMDYSEKRLRDEIKKLPDGEYIAPTAWLDDDGRNRDVRLRVETKVIVKGDHVTIDLTGSNAEVPTGYNVPFEGSLLVAAYFAIRTILLDQDRLDEPVPQNDGIFRCVDVIAPKGTIFNPNFPRACFSRFNQCQRVVDNTIVALSKVVPDLVTAGNSAAIHFCSYAGFIPEKGEYWLYLEVNEGSYGGRKGRDGMDSVDCLMANTRNNPIEELGMRFPMITERYEFVTSRPRRDSGVAASASTVSTASSSRGRTRARATVTPIRRAASSAATTVFRRWSATTSRVAVSRRSRPR
jgi:N-methylhydantoinase B/oxoprolinase/acetone carboxylase alpha subunit